MGGGTAKGFTVGRGLARPERRIITVERKVNRQRLSGLIKELNRDSMTAAEWGSSQNSESGEPG